MSGSSLDGLDLVYAEFHHLKGRWTYKTLGAVVTEFSAHWVNRLQRLSQTDAKNLWQAHSEFGRYLGEQVSHFIAQNALSGKVDFIA